MDQPGGRSLVGDPGLDPREAAALDAALLTDETVRWLGRPFETRAESAWGQTLMAAPMLAVWLYVAYAASLLVSISGDLSQLTLGRAMLLALGALGVPVGLLLAVMVFTAAVALRHRAQVFYALTSKRFLILDRAGRAAPITIWPEHITGVEEGFRGPVSLTLRLRPGTRLRSAERDKLELASVRSPDVAAALLREMIAARPPLRD